MYYIRRTWNTAYPKLYLFRYIQTGVRKIAPRKIAPRSGSGFGLGLALELGLGGGAIFLEPFRHTQGYLALLRHIHSFGCIVKAYSGLFSNI